MDVDPCQNPYHEAEVVLPELDTSYLGLTGDRPGGIRPDGPVVRAFAPIGWRWGGDYHSLKDDMHSSTNVGGSPWLNVPGLPASVVGRSCLAGIAGP